MDFPVLVKQSSGIHVEYLIVKYPFVFVLPYIGDLHFKAAPVWIPITLSKENNIPVVFDSTTKKISQLG